MTAAGRAGDATDGADGPGGANRRLRILVYGVNYAPEPTGTGRYTGEMAAWLAAQGHEVHAIAAPPHYPEWQVAAGHRNRYRKEAVEGVQVRRVPLYVPPRDKLSGARRVALESTFTAAAGAPWLRRLAGRKYDLVVAVCPPLQVAVYPWMYRGLRRVPWVFHIQDLQVDAAFRLGLLKGGFFERRLFGIENFLLRHATRVSTITEAMRQRIVAKGVPPERTWLFPNWSDVRSIVPGPRDNAFRRELGLGADDVLVLYSGNMGRKQGLDLVVRAAQALDDPRIHIVMAGSGADEPRIRALAEQLRPPRLRLLPVQPAERFAQMLAAADIHLVVQKREAADLVMPSKLTNILAAGRPSIATADPGTALHQVLTSNDAGLVTPVDDLDAFVAAIRTLAQDPARRQAMGENARRYAERHLDKQTILREFEAKLVALVEEEGLRRRRH